VQITGGISQRYMVEHDASWVTLQEWTTRGLVLERAWLGKTLRVLGHGGEGDVSLVMYRSVTRCRSVP
jgi:hypothetical protein